MENKYEFFQKSLSKALPLGQSFDLLQRKIRVTDREATLYFIDGLVDATRLQILLSSFMLKEDKLMRERWHSVQEFIEERLPYADASLTDDVNTVVEGVLKGLVPLVVDGFDKIIMMEIKDYPSRSVEEPSKEKSLRGAKDGFTENFMTNIALIRRRTRSSNLIFEHHRIGSDSGTDVAIVYMKGLADAAIVEKLSGKLSAVQVNTMTVAEQSVVEALMRDETKGKNRLSIFNPFPKVRYTQRPDVVSAHLTEGRIVIMVDNSPTAILLPSSVFDFVQEVDDYYFPVATGNYFRILRIINVFTVIFASPLFYLMAEGDIYVYEQIKFFIPDRDYAIPIFWQFLLMEMAIDGLKFASLNTPDSLGMSLSVIGALILGQFSVDSGWFIPQTILVMAVVTLGSFALPSIELGYAVKGVRLLILIGAAIYGVYGAVIALVLSFIIMASTKTLVGTSYLYPVIPYNKEALKKVIFRTPQKRKN